MPNYQKGKIYKITSSGGDPYIGSTVELLCQRLAGHRRRNKGIKRSPLSSYIHTNQLDCQITLIENFPCKNKEELLARERYWFENIINCNKHYPNRKHKEYSQAHKNKKRIYDKIYHQLNKEKNIERARNLYEANKNTINEVRKRKRLYLKELQYYDI